MIEVKIIGSSLRKRDFLDLLLLADEQEDMIDRYLDRGVLFALYDGDLKSVCVVTDEGNGTFEIQSLATYPHFQKRGYGRYLINYVCDYYKDNGTTMILGTGDTPVIVPFYEKSGFVISHRIENFFIEHYREPIFEHGVQLKDKVYLIRSLRQATGFRRRAIYIMDYSAIINGMKRYGSTETDICVHGIGIPPEQVQERVILAPWWEPSSLPDLGEAEYLSASASAAVKVWNIASENGNITYIKTGIGAPVLMDVLLSLGVTKCRTVIFIGSVGALDENIGIGDIVIPEFSVCGDGASRYIASDTLEHDCWGEKVYPDPALLSKIKLITENACGQYNVKWHPGRTFSIDTITAQFAHIDTFLTMNCNVIEMETAAAFRAAKIAEISMAAIFSVSDNTVLKKTLISGRTDEEMRYRKFVRRTLFPNIILEALLDNTIK